MDIRDKKPQAAIQGWRCGPCPPPLHVLRGVRSPGSAGCYPLTAVTMRVAILAELVGTVLAGSLVGWQSLRAGSVDSASHEHLLEVSLSVLQRAERPPGILPPSGPSSPDVGQLLCGKAIGSAQRCLNPSFPALLLPPPFPPLRLAQSGKDNQIPQSEATKSCLA